MLKNDRTRTDTETTRTRARPGRTEAPAETPLVGRARTLQRLAGNQATRRIVERERRSGAGREDPAALVATAQRGVAGGGSPLPFLDRIQASFGRHDLASARAHTGPGARASARAIDAAAYTVGGDVAFARAPTLHTAAHEAAHVIQQRAGIHLAGGVGAVGDVHERHADAVADAVVSGRSAEPLLDACARTGSRTAGTWSLGVVQRKENNAKSGGDQQLRLGPAPAVDLSINDRSLERLTRHPYYPTFKARFEAFLATIQGLSPDVQLPFATLNLWSEVLAAMQSGQEGMKDPNAYSNYGNRWVDMSSKVFQDVLHLFDRAMATLRRYASSQFHRAKSFGFWSKPAGQKLAENTCDLTLETSGIGALFDGIPSLDKVSGAWDPHLWAALSNAYATAVADELGKGKRDKTAHVCLGPDAAAGNIFDVIESAAVKKNLVPSGLEIDRQFAAVTRFHAAATDGTPQANLDPNVHDGDFKGTAWSGASLDEARAKANAYRDAKQAAVAAAAALAAAPAAAPHP